MSTFLKLWQAEPPPQPDEDTERLEPAPVFSLAGMQQMVTLIDHDGKEHWVQKGSLVYRVMRSHGYRIGGAS